MHNKSSQKTLSRYRHSLHMDKKSVQDALLALTHEMECRSKTAQLQQVLPQIEDAQRAGVRNARIVETLNNQGFALTLKTFEMMLYRIRERHRTKREKTTDTPAFPAEGLSTNKGVNQPSLLNLPVTPIGFSASQERTRLLSDDFADLDEKQKRERLGNHFIPDAPANPLLKRIKKDT
ncbi:hypothetical protein [Rhodoferax sp. GW822-FHT02A01]|uniref:hypothetical protein n=1 Tax=Rhodoferax sp. GW822-FHT02A01 TaxID=3141537 RepID=UPI00315CD90E